VPTLALMMKMTRDRTKDQDDDHGELFIHIDNERLADASSSSSSPTTTPSALPSPPTQRHKQNARLFLCLAHVFSEFSEWVWQFSVVVWLTSLGSGEHSSRSSLFLNSSYQAASQLFVFFLVPRLTKYVNVGSNRFNRGHFMSCVILSQIPCISIAAVLFGKEMSNLSYEGDTTSGSFGSTTTMQGEDGGLAEGGNASNSDDIMFATLVAIYICGGLAQVLQMSYGVAIHRDWVVAVSEGDEKWLTTTNTILRQIYLCCVILGPSFAVLLHSRSEDSGVIWVGFIKIASLLMMNMFVVLAYRTTASLQSEGTGESTVVAKEGNLDECSPAQDESVSPPSHHCSYIDDLRVFVSQKAVWAGIALSLLYCDVLTFGGVMTTYLKACGMEWSVIGACQGASNLAGLIGTCLFAISQQYLDVRTTAMWGICWQFACLTIAICGVVMNQTNKLLSARLIIAGVIPSRIGLLVFVLACTQFYQQTVRLHLRGQIGGTQTSLNSFFEFIPFLLGMVYSDVDDYWIVMVVSYFSVATATLVVVLGVYLPRKRSKEPCANIELKEISIPESASVNAIV